MIARLAEIRRNREDQQQSMQNALQPRQGKGAGLAQLLAVLGVGTVNKLRGDNAEEEQAIMNFSEANRQADQDIINSAGTREDLMRILLGSPDQNNQMIGRQMLMQPTAKPVETFSGVETIKLPDGKGGVVDVPIQRNKTTNRMYPLKTGGGNQTVNVIPGKTPPPSEKFDKKMWEQAATQFTEASKAYPLLKEQNYSLDKVKNAIANGAKTGLGQETIMNFKKLGGLLGMEIDPEISEQELVQSVQNRIAMLVRNPDSGGGLPGAASNRDVKFLVNSVPGLMKTPGGNLILIDMLQKVNTMKMDFYEFQSGLLKNGRAPADFIQKRDDFIFGYDLLTDDERKRIESFNPQTQKDLETYGGVLMTSPQQAIPTIQTVQERDNPPLPGAVFNTRDGKWYVQQNGQWFEVQQ